MIAKMKFLKVVAPVSKLDHVISDYILKYEVQIENAMAELGNIPNLTSHNDVNPYKEELAKITEYTEGFNMKKASSVKEKITYEEAVQIIGTYEEALKSVNEERRALREELAHKKELLKEILPFSGVQYDIKKLSEFKFIKFRFGKIPKIYFKHLSEFMIDDSCSIFCECSRNENYVWLMYFAPENEIHEVDALYSSMYFERLLIEEEYKGSPDEIISNLRAEIKELKNSISEKRTIINEYKKANKGDLVTALKCITELNDIFELRRKFAFINSKDGERFILCCWMQANDADKIIEELSCDDDIKVISEGDEHTGLFGGAPVKLKNPKILKPFEMLINMYGLPSYKEFDPTWFVAISYTLIFGMMFGDVGQGLVLMLGGFLLYKIKKMNLAAIISVAGLFSTIFGFMFGSVFGYEELIEPLWLKPTIKMTDLPFVGRMNTVFVFAILLGMIMILIMMIFNVINAAKEGKFTEALFDHNGICGFIFYAAVVTCVILFMTGNALPATIVTAVTIGLPLLLIILKDPLLAIVFKKTEHMPKEKGIFVVQIFFEMFEVLLSYFSNTLSFVRVGGFAVSHASMMAVVLMLAGAEGGGVGNLAVIIIGNIIVCGLEGLIVGIQVMRLEYYEMFSRFYRGGGREFKPYKSVINKQRIKK